MYPVLDLLKAVDKFNVMGILCGAIVCSSSNQTNAMLAHYLIDLSNIVRVYLSNLRVLSALLSTAYIWAAKHHICSQCDAQVFGFFLVLLALTRLGTQ